MNEEELAIRRRQSAMARMAGMFILASAIFASDCSGRSYSQNNREEQELRNIQRELADYDFNHRYNQEGR